jgi:REP element-mobilizing transposase RayT
LSRTIGIHWIATTHGTWLHGDPRGSWQNGKLIGPDPFLEESIRERMTADAVVLSCEEVGVVADEFGNLVVERNWKVFTATIQPTHVHIVFARLADPIETVVAALKYRSARAVWALRRERGLTASRSLWTEGRFVVFLDNEVHLENVVAYVRVGFSVDPYPWINAKR